jgi:hypothetical protein
MSGKGSSFEREICKRLSKWWTYDSRDDIFWRSSMSGGRSTVRFRQGLRTAGGDGDICALDPIGQPLLKLFTVELKRGRSHGDPGDLLDCSGSLACHPFLATLDQAKTAADKVGNDWLLICKRDRRKATAFFSARCLLKDQPLHSWQPELIKPPVFRYRFGTYDFVGMTLDKFLSTVDPASLAAILE